MFNYHEALLTLVTITEWADGESQDSEKDTLVQMMLHEKISDNSLDSFKAKYKTLKNYEEAFEEAVKALRSCSTEQKARVCAWMLRMSTIARAGSKGELNYEEDVWIESEENISLKELQWINRARKALEVSLDDQRKEFNKLPEIKRIY